MRTKFLLLLFVGFTLILSSCHDDLNNEPIINNNPIINSDTISRISYNPYLPIDTNKIYIYDCTSIMYNDVDVDSNDVNSITTNTLNSLKITNIYIFQNTEVFNLANNIFGSNDSIIYIFWDENDSIDGLNKLNLVYTNIDDTIWSKKYYIYGNEFNCTFNQTKNKETDEITISIIDDLAGGYNNLCNEYTFKKNVGLISSYSYIRGVNCEYTNILTEYINKKSFKR